MSACVVAVASRRVGRWSTLLPAFLLRQFTIDNASAPRVITVGCDVSVHNQLGQGQASTAHAQLSTTHTRVCKYDR